MDNLHAKLAVSSYNCSRDTEGTQNSKSRLREHFTSTFDIILHFVCLGPLVDNLHSKLDVSSYNCSRDMEAIPTFYKLVT